MRAIIVGSLENVEVIGEEFAIDGTDERFIVHRSLSNSYCLPLWNATHLATSFICGRGDTPDEAIANARERWLAATPETRKAAIERAAAETAMNIAERANRG